MSTIKDSVIESYGKLAKSVNKNPFSKLFACCDPTEVATQVGEKIGYSQEEMSAVPESANLGVGCGNPAAFSNIKEGDTVVDLGSGAGFDAFLASPIVGERGKVIGIDLSDEMLALANKNIKKGNYSNVSFVKGDIEDIPLEDEICDHIISNCVINLSLNKGAVYREAYRILKPGGMLAISDIVLEKELPEAIKNSLAGHIACVSGAENIEDYLQYVTDAGFKEVRIEGKRPFPLEIMLSDPQVIQLAQQLNFDLGSEEARDLASRVSSISLRAKK